jgi:peroxiredoxin
MANKLAAGQIFPDTSITLSDGNAMHLPSDMGNGWKVIIFFRGNWWSFCRRQLDGFRAIKQELENRNITVVAASSDPQDKAGEMASNIDLPVGFGVNQEMIESLGGYWQATRQFAQPAEFLLDPNNKIVQLSYSDGPLARNEAADVIKLVDHLSKS